MITIGGMAGVTQGIPVGVRAPGMQTGGMVPGSGHGDIIPAMLEPGEAIIPRYLVPLIAPILAAHRVPGFGGMPQSSASHFAAGGIVPHVLGFPDPATVQGKTRAVRVHPHRRDHQGAERGGAKKIADALVGQDRQGSRPREERRLRRDARAGVRERGALREHGRHPGHGERHRAWSRCSPTWLGAVLHEGHRRRSARGT